MIYNSSSAMPPPMQPFRPEQLVITVEKNGSRQKGGALLKSFFDTKNKSKLPVFIYLIQRL